MNNKKKLFLICAIVIVFLVVFVVVLIRPRREESADVFLPDTVLLYDEDEEDTMSDTISDTMTEEVYTQMLAEEGDELKEEFSRNFKQDVLDEEGNVTEQRRDESTTLKANQNISIVPSESEEMELDNTEFEEDDEEEFVLTPMEAQGYAEYEVVCDVAGMEEAEAIAEQISGTVTEVENGVATIQISVHVDELLNQLESQGSTLKIHRKYFYVLQ